MSASATDERGVVRAAGGVVVRRDGGKARYLVVHRPRYDDWSLPKGKLDKGESDESAARREVEEETGVATRLVRELTPHGYRERTGKPKHVRWWLMAPLGDPDAPRAPDREVDEVRWVRRREARELLTYQQDVDLVLEAHAFTRRADVTVPPVLLTRHAHAGDRASWTGSDDRKRPLSPRGEGEARRLVAQLAGYAPARVLASPLKRCVQTVTPLAKALGCKVEKEPRLGEGTSASDVRALVREVTGQRVVLCTHGDIIAAQMTRLHADGVALDHDLAWPKGSTWVLPTRGGEIVGGTLLDVP